MEEYCQQLLSIVSHFLAARVYRLTAECRGHTLLLIFETYSGAHNGTNKCNVYAKVFLIIVNL